MAIIVEGPLAHSTAVVAKSQVVVGLAPSKCLRSRQNCLLLRLLVITDLAVFAPARLIFAFLTVLAAICIWIIHLVHVVEAARNMFFFLFRDSGRCNYIIPPKVINVAVLRVQLRLHLLDFCDDRCLCLPSFFLHSHEQDNLI